ncbi:unnamed protein product [Heligmosomoides polygyrus]|uniref:G_PROTEIN_RECEP_F1_2 domain-containing protein n=1 Tax=Heligmosomoides polygyrus TaxID=6339 RepID=A0A183FIP7_HELPZ|nr:unnamed protein product [Heligmosomoides polygyrus]
MILIPANQPRQQLLPMLARVLPQYTFVGETVTGHTNVFEWKVCTAILHMTLPITPVYIGILLLRRRIVAMLSVNAMSESTKKIHKQLLRALTYQATLPCVFLMGVLSYAIGQLGVCQHPILETLTFFCFGTLPVLSPLMSLYFIGPYRRIISMCLLGAVSKVFPTKCQKPGKPIPAVQCSSYSVSFSVP